MSKEFIDKNVQLGPFIKCPHPEMIEACELAGYHFVVIDMEHTPLSPRDLYPLVLAAERRGIEMVVRIPANEESYFKWCLDLGIRYLQVPHVQSREDAEYAVKHAFFHPKGERGLCRFVRAADFSAKEKNQYLEGSKDTTKLILQVEGKKGLENIDSILSVEGVEILFIGPYDLSQSLGKPGQIWDKEVVSAMQKIVLAAQKRHVKVGTFTDTAEGVKFWAKNGIPWIEYASDLNIFIQGSEKLRREINDV